jgi:hypothetical protein
MTAELGCEQVRELAPELALGIAEGEERDAALRDLSGCRGAASWSPSSPRSGTSFCSWRRPTTHQQGSSPASWPASPSRHGVGASGRSPAAGNGCSWPRPAIVGSPPATGRF